MKKSFIKARPRFREPYRLETGFSMLEAVVVVGVLLALAVGGFISYGTITESAKKAAVKSAASSVHTAVVVASVDGDPSTDPQDAIVAWNASTDQIEVEILAPEAALGAMTTAAATPSANGDFCVQATNKSNTSIKARAGSCSGVSEGGGGTPPPAADPLPAVSSSTFKFGLATDNVSAGNETDATARLVNESPSMISFYMDWTRTVNPVSLKAISDKGAVPVITWEPWVATADPNGVNQPAYKLSTIPAGNHDTYIKKWANDLKAYNKPVMLRFAHEMNGNWYPWSEQVNGNAPGDYVAAWKHVVDTFRAEGATNVQWIWAPNVQQPGISTAALYPGSTYVDYTGVDGFNWGADRPWTGPDGWQNPWDVLDSSMVEIAGIAPDKSMIVTEIGTVESENGHSKAQWINDMVYYLNHWSEGHPGTVAGFIWFDLNKENDWRIGSSTESAEAMKSALGRW